MPAASTFEIQRVSPGDLDRMKAILALFGTVFEEPDTYGGAVPDDGYLRRLLAKDHFIALAAVEDGRVIGALTAYELEKYERARSEIYIYDLAVDGGQRRRGVATALIDAVRDIGTDRGAWVVIVQADWDDEAPISLYSKLGTREDVVHFDIPVAVA